MPSTFEVWAVFDGLRCRLRALRLGSALDRELNAEVRFHLEMETEKNIARGMSPEAAREAAFRSFGPMEKHKAETRDARGIFRFEQLVQDLRYGARTLGRNPGFACMAIITLALGIGANAAIFSIVHAAFFAQYPLRDPNRLVRIYGDDPQRGATQLNLSVPKYQLLREQQTSFDSLVAAGFNGLTLQAAGEAVQVPGAYVTSDFLDTFGATPILGRFFRADEEAGAPVAVIGEDMWRSRFGADPAILGRTLVLSGQPVSVVGIAPRLPAFWNADVWLTSPMQFPGVTADVIQRGFSFLSVVGRLKSTGSSEQATQELTLLASRYRSENGGAADAQWAFSLVGLRDDIIGATRSSLLTLLAAVGLLLVTACANVANLLLVRTAGRRQEIGLRTALGASRGRVVRQFLIESLLLTSIATGLGTLLAYAALPTLLLLAGNNLAFAGDVRINARVLMATTAVACLAGLFMSIYPSMQGSRPDIMMVLRTGSRALASSGASHRARRVMVAGQVAVSLLLLIGALLLVTSFMRLRNQPAGFDSSGVFVAAVNLPAGSYPNPAAQEQLYRRLADAIATSPGVVRASLGQSVPLTNTLTRAPYAVAEGVVPPLNDRPLGITQSVLPGYLETLRIPLLAGRDFSNRDTATSPLVAIVSASTARKLFPDVRDVLGRRIVMGSQDGGQIMEIVGVVGDVRSQTLASPPDVEFYRPVAQRPRSFMQIVARVEGDPASFEATARRAIGLIDPGLPLVRVSTLPEVVSQSLAQQRLLFTLLVVFAGVAVALSAIGIYGVVAAFVGQRTPEIGLRMALGARRLEVLHLVLRQSGVTVATGLSVGVIAAIGLSRFVQHLLFEVSALDIATMTAATIGLASIASLACLVPALRAARINPVIALRGE